MFIYLIFLKACGWFMKNDVNLALVNHLTPRVFPRRAHLSPAPLARGSEDRSAAAETRSSLRGSCTPPRRRSRSPRAVGVTWRTKSTSIRKSGGERVGMLLGTLPHLTPGVLSLAITCCCCWCRRWCCRTRWGDQRGGGPWSSWCDEDATVRDTSDKAVGPCASLSHYCLFEMRVSQWECSPSSRGVGLNVFSRHKRREEERRFNCPHAATHAASKPLHTPPSLPLSVHWGDIADTVLWW